MKYLIQLTVYFFLCSLVPICFGQQQEPTCKWSTTTNGCTSQTCSSEPGESPLFNISAGGCVHPGGGCSGTAPFCCDNNQYEVYWIGTPPNCVASCSMCEEDGDYCFGNTSRRVCTESGQQCTTGYQLLCGRIRNGGPKAVVGNAAAFAIVREYIIL